MATKFRYARKRRVDPYPSQAELAILASFVFCPMGKESAGRTGSQVARVCPQYFWKRFQYPRRPIRGTGTNLPWQANVTHACKRLVKLGFLHKTGTREWGDKFNSAVVGVSPIFNLTEAGMAQVLGRLDHDSMMSAQEAFGVYHAKNKAQYTMIQHAFSSYVEDRFFTKSVWDEKDDTDY